jgi:hypothetical protein
MTVLRPHKSATVPAPIIETDRTMVDSDTDNAALAGEMAKAREKRGSSGCTL